MSMSIMSLEDIFKIFYFLGLSKCATWDACMHSIRMDIMNVDSSDYADVINVYMKLIALGKRVRLALEICLNVASQDKLSLIDTFVYDITDIYDHLQTNVLHFNEKCIEKSTFNVINNFVKNFLFAHNNTNDTDVIMKNDNVDDDDDDEEEIESDDNELDEIFKSVKVKKDNNKSTLLFEQSVLFNSHGAKGCINSG